MDKAHSQNFFGIDSLMLTIAPIIIGLTALASISIVLSNVTEEIFGVFGFYQSISLIAFQISASGSQTLQRWLSVEQEKRGTDKWYFVALVKKYSIFAAFIFLPFIILALFANLIFESPETIYIDVSKLFFLVLFNYLLASFNLTFQKISIVFQKFRIYWMMNLLENFLRLIFVIIFFEIFPSENVSIFGYAYSLVLASLCGTLIWIFLIKFNFLNHLKNNNKNSPSDKEMIDFTFWTSLLTVSNLYALQFVPVILGITQNYELVAFYVIALQLFSVISAIGASLQNRFIPLLIGKFQTFDNHKRIETFKKTITVSVILSSLLWILASINLDWFLHFWIGSNQMIIYFFLSLSMIGFITILDKQNIFILQGFNDMKSSVIFSHISFFCTFVIFFAFFYLSSYEILSTLPFFLIIPTILIYLFRTNQIAKKIDAKLSYLLILKLILPLLTIVLISNFMLESVFISISTSTILLLFSTIFIRRMI